jgi:cephalosporin-C deacetylase-like acetyl esterase
VKLPVDLPHLATLVEPTTELCRAVMARLLGAVRSYRTVSHLVLLVTLGGSCLGEPATRTRGESSDQGESISIVPVPPPLETDLIQISADRDDCTYLLGESPIFRVKVGISPYPAEGVHITYRLGPEQFEGAKVQATVPLAGLVIEAGPCHEPGLVRLLVSASLDGRATEAAMSTVAFAPARIRPTQTEPADFDSFWDEQKAALAQVPAEPELTPLPDLSTSTVEVFHWSAQNVGNWEGHSRIYGILTVPRTPGRFPASLHAPGAGVRGYAGQLALASKGVITLQIGIHGMPVNLAPEVYSQLGRAGLAHYPVSSLDDRDKYYYRRVYLGCIRANDFLTSHPKWDGKNLLVSGSSQGGMLSIITAALDSRVTLLAASYPAYCDVTGYLHGRAGGWPGIFRPAGDGTLQTPCPEDPRLVTTSYYDTVNFARRLKVPGCYSFGYNDTVCPPTSMFAAYNSITAPKELVISPEQGHHLSKVQIEQRARWVDTHRGLNPP